MLSPKGRRQDRRKGQEARCAFCRHCAAHGQGFYVQVMATSSELEAERTVKKLALLGLPAYRAAVDRKATTLWRVRVGLYKTKKEAEGVVGTIVLNGIASKPIVGLQ